MGGVRRDKDVGGRREGKDVGVEAEEERRKKKKRDEEEGRWIKYQQEWIRLILCVGRARACLGQ